MTRWQMAKKHAADLPLLLLVALKIIVDLRAHLYEHRRPLRMRDYQALAGVPGAKHTPSQDRFPSSSSQ